MLVKGDETAPAFYMVGVDSPKIPYQEFTFSVATAPYPRSGDVVELSEGPHFRGDVVQGFPFLFPEGRRLLELMADILRGMVLPS